MKILLISLSSLLFSGWVAAQTTQTVDDETAQVDGGLQVNEVRNKDRLDRVEVRHREQGLTDVFDLNSTSAVYQEGGINERSTLRVWQFKLGK